MHRAVSHDGRQLAVKVQHVGLRDTCAADTVIVEAFVKGLRWFFPDFNYQWLVDELKESVPTVTPLAQLQTIAEVVQEDLRRKQEGLRSPLQAPRIAPY